MVTEKEHFFARIGNKEIFLKDQKRYRDAIKLQEWFPPFNDLSAPFEHMLMYTAFSCYEFFHSNGYRIPRAAWESKGVSPSLMSYHGWVYAFYAKQDCPLYIGETGRTIKVRFNEHEKGRYKKTLSWWSDWDDVKILPCPNKSMRKIFESLMGMAGGYCKNKAQPPEVDNILEDVILSLLLLGYDDEGLPKFPNHEISSSVNTLRALLDHQLERELLEYKLSKNSGCDV